MGSKGARRVTHTSAHGPHINVKWETGAGVDEKRDERDGGGSPAVSRDCPLVILAPARTNVQSLAISFSSSSLSVAPHCRASALQITSIQSATTPQPRNV